MIAPILASLLLLTSCQTLTEPDYRTSCESGCRETVAVPLSAADTAYWMQRARDEVQRQADSGAIRLSVPLSQLADPRVEWRPCPWSCGDCYDLPGGGSSPGFDHCAAGLTSSDGRTIYVSTWERARRGVLVQWEMTNSLYLRTGNGNLASKIGE